MAQLVLLVVAAAWAAVLIPPMLRSRVENRPNSSVTDFRRQLNKLQSSATPSRGAIRPIGRPLAQSPLQRPAAAGRPGGHHPHHRQSSLRGGTATAQRNASSVRTPDHVRDGQRFRSHGDSTREHERPHRQEHMHRVGSDRRDAAPRRDPGPRQVDPRTAVRRRRTNVLFILVVTAACTLFLAATTTSTVMPWVFAAAFLALCGYVYMLAQLRQRDEFDSRDGWLETR